MKKIILTLALLTTPLLAGPYCIDNSEHLTKSYDDKEWHSVECACDCTTIKGNHCIECGHMQNAHPTTIIEPKKTRPITQSKIYTPANPQNTLKRLAAKYIKNKYDI